MGTECTVQGRLTRRHETGVWVKGTSLSLSLSRPAPVGSRVFVPTGDYYTLSLELGYHPAAFHVSTFAGEAAIEPRGVVH